MIRDRFKSFIASLLTRKAVFAVISSVFVACNYILGWGLDETQIGMILLPIGGFILAEGTADVVSRAKTGTIVRTETKSVMSQNIDNDPEAPDPSGGVMTGAARVRRFDEKEEDE